MPNNPIGLKEDNKPGKVLRQYITEKKVFTYHSEAYIMWCSSVLAIVTRALLQELYY